ncbi:hypothetical protein ABG768_015251 [Culter alburnus]|uniref:C2H2-type domain-containing protein n=1 Tax=Culter alburnus TaxID=194366 RepID=A0AAW1Z514_CULAL
MHIHIHVANVMFNCALLACNKSFKKFSDFKTHCYQHKEGKSKLKSMPLKDALSQPESTEMAHLHIKLLMSHFQEHEDGLLLHADVAASAADVEKKLNLHASPCLILLG